MKVPGIEIIRDVPRGTFKHVLFDFDGTISLLREGWQAIMGPMMAKAICGDRPATQDITERIEAFIDDTTGIQTILQMEELVDLVKEYAFVPESEILDAQGYKEIYNDALMVPVNERLARLSTGALSADDATVQGAPEFVGAAAGQDAALYIFSGTNRDDVRNEADALGVAHHFTEIWGALRTFKEYSKEKILTEMIAEHRLEGPEVLVIGDGPVEIRLAHEHGCVSIGVASDEVNGGLDPAKRDRLLNVGADIIVPDFDRGDALIEYLF
jgi:phosphoglycolate phosphatase-like HAD superfamily hydrolase